MQDGNEASDEQLKEQLKILLRVLHDMNVKVVQEFVDTSPAGEMTVKWLENLMPSVITVATLGASITFTVIVQQLPPPQYWSIEMLRTLLSISWLLFVLSLGLASAGSLILAFHRKPLVGYYNRKEKEWPRQGSAPSALWKKPGYWLACTFKEPFTLVLLLCMLSAFFFLALVVFAYSRNVGIAALIFVSLFVAATALTWFMQHFVSPLLAYGQC